MAWESLRLALGMIHQVEFGRATAIITRYYWFFKFQFAGFLFEEFMPFKYFLVYMSLKFQRIGWQMGFGSSKLYSK